METLVQYGSSDDEETTNNISSHSCSTLIALPIVNTAPEVHSDDTMTQYLNVDQKQMTLNLPINTSLSAYHGPENMYSRQINPEMIGSGKEIVTGIVEPANMEDFSFETQYHTYNKKHTGIVQNVEKIENSGVDGIISLQEDNIMTRRTIKKKKQNKEKKKKTFEEEFGNQNEHGIWAPFKEKDPFEHLKLQKEVLLTQEQIKIREEKANERKRKAEEAKKYDDEMDFDRMIEKKQAHLLPARLRAGQEAMQAKSIFMGEEEYDYQGRSWIEHPRTLKPDEDGQHQVFLPKKCIHKWTGHTKGVHCIELFPKYGHLLLSGSMDHTVRIWDVYKEKKCQRIYEGHSGAIRGINFSNDGRQFLTCSFDRFIHLWDTETGQSIQSFTNRRVPYCIKFYPEDNNQFIIGDSNNMIVQFDTRSKEIVQEYNHHLQAVNSVTFVDDNKRFVSTSDDKKILIWEWGIPVPIKYISEPSMHSMPSVTLHPSGGFFAGQSLNNQIDVYTARDKFKLCRKKVFRGHSNAGYACQIGFSPNGQYLMSGDGEGKICFWDWKSTKMYKKLKAHDHGPCMGAIWHPIEPSKVISCGWDGTIKYWD